MLTTLAATVTEPQALQTLAHAIMIGFGFFGPTIGMGMIGAHYMSAVGRNPEASKFLGQALVFVGLVEVYGLLAFASTFFVK